MTQTLWLMIMVSLALPVMCQVEESCPWMNAATAGGILGGAVTVTVAHPDENKDDANCEFLRHQGKTASALIIKVHTMNTPAVEFKVFKSQCGANAVPLKAIGNEAIACSVGKLGQIAEQVVGRVRNRCFIVHINTNDPSAEQSPYREKAIKAAEQVAGNLF